MYGGLLFVAVAILVFATTGSDAPAGSYAERLATFRSEKDHSFATASDSPIPDAQRAAFAGLKYYAPDSTYRTTATFAPHQAGAITPENVQAHFQLENGDGLSYAGQIHFTLQGQPQQLAAYRAQGRPAEELFVPFRDATSGTETYGSGRYLDLKLANDNSTVLDFNYAYQPYCAYNPQYVCALPPRANRLAIAIRAGERL